MRGREIEVEATNMAHGGESVARFDGRVVFVADAIPGERVVARVTDDAKKSFWRAETVRVIEPSPHRRPHVWAEASIDRDPANRPGGADYGHIELRHQRTLKAAVLADALARMAKVERDVVVEPLPGADDGTGWRTRERLHVAEDGTLGPYAARSHRVIRVADLPLAVAAVREHAPLTERMPGAGEVTIIAASVGDGARLVIGAQKPTVIRERVGDREPGRQHAGQSRIALAALEEGLKERFGPVQEDRQDEPAKTVKLQSQRGVDPATVFEVVPRPADQGFADHLGGQRAARQGEPDAFAKDGVDQTGGVSDQTHPSGGDPGWTFIERDRVPTPRLGPNRAGRQSTRQIAVEGAGHAVAPCPGADAA